MALRAGYGFGSWGLGGHAPLPGRNDGRGAPLRPPCAEGVAVIGPVGHQAGPRRARPGFHQGPAAAIRQGATGIQAR